MSKPSHWVSGQNNLVLDALELSSGTLATLTGYRRYSDLDRIQSTFVGWCQKRKYENWVDAWVEFWSAQRYAIETYPKEKPCTTFYRKHVA